MIYVLYFAFSFSTRLSIPVGTHEHKISGVAFDLRFDHSIARLTQYYVLHSTCGLLRATHIILKI